MPRASDNRGTCHADEVFDGQRWLSQAPGHGDLLRSTSDVQVCPYVPAVAGLRSRDTYGYLCTFACTWHCTWICTPTAGVDGVADPPLEGPERFFVRLTLGYFLVVVGAAVAVLVPDLGDRGHVDRVVDAAVAAQRQAVDLAIPGGHLDRGGAVIGGEVVAAGEAGHVGDVAGDGAGDDRAGAEHLGEGGAGSLTAAASFLRVSRSWASRRRMSSRNSAASSARARSTAPDGGACSRILAA